MDSRDKLKELTRCGLFTTIALILFVIEAKLPAPLPIAGAKLGLSNGVTLYVAYTMGVTWAWKVLFARIVLGAFFAGQLMTLLYSATGGVCTLLFLWVVRGKTTRDQIWIVSPFCAIVHNLGQTCVATVVMGTTAIWYFLPYLLLLAVVSGLFVGVVAQNLVKRDLNEGNLSNP